MQGGKHWSILEQSRVYRRLVRKACLCLQITPPNASGSMGESTSATANALNLGDGDYSCGLIKGRSWPWSPHPDDYAERCQPWPWKEAGSYAAPESAPEGNPHSLLFPDLGIKVLATTALSKQLGRWFSPCCSDSPHTRVLQTVPQSAADSGFKQPVTLLGQLLLSGPRGKYQ